MNFDARVNRVEDNDVSDSRAADLALVTSIDNGKDPGGNCFWQPVLDLAAGASGTLVPCGRAASAMYETDLAAS
ncbi:MAG TPA: hypothetical protein VL119_05710 [Acidimicrobiia bacterium]|nr:hypothetical protein [Acidimicrobiia bacterium]